MTADDVLKIYSAADALGATFWIDGGWAVDALLGRQTRPHEDLDIALEERHAVVLRSWLVDNGYRDVPRDDTCRWNYVLGDTQGRQVDFHTFILDEQGVVIEGMKYAEGSLSGSGTIAGRPVRCIEPSFLVRAHTGYAIRDKDRQDVAALCAHFGLPLPSEYASERT